MGVKRKKSTLKKETSVSSSSSSKSSDKIKFEIKEESTEIKVEVDVEVENSKVKKETIIESDENTTRKSTRNTKKKIKKEEEEVEEEVDTKSLVMKSKANFEKKIINKSEDTVKTVKFTGKIPVDEQCIEAIGNDYHIYIENDVAYDCMLNQVIKKKKFYMFFSQLNFIIHRQIYNSIITSTI